MRNGLRGTEGRAQPWDHNWVLAANGFTEAAQVQYLVASAITGLERLQAAPALLHLSPLMTLRITILWAWEGAAQPLPTLRLLNTVGWSNSLLGQKPPCPPPEAGSRCAPALHTTQQF